MKKSPQSGYIDGFWAGQAVAYCEQVRNGLRLAGEIACPSIFIGALVLLVAEEGLKSAVEQTCPRLHRATIWIYKDDLVKRVIDYLRSGETSEVNVWGMGKIFGYADCEIIKFIRRSM